MHVGSVCCSCLPVSCFKGALLAELLCKVGRTSCFLPLEQGTPHGAGYVSCWGSCCQEQGAKKTWLQWDLNTMVLGTVLAFDMECCLFSLYRNSPELSLPCQSVRHCQKAPSLWLPTNSSRRLSDTERRIMNRFGIDKLPKHCPLCLKSH